MASTTAPPTGAAEGTGGSSRRGSTVYRGDLGMWSWVAHRITGVLTFFFLFAHVLDTAVVRVSPNAYDKVIELMGRTGFAWDLVDYQVRSEGHEYSLFFVFQKLNGTKQQFSFKRDRPRKTACIVRYGAFGDLLQTSSVAAGLKDQGYHVTLMTSPPGHQVIEADPNIDEFYLQEKDQVPNHMLGDYWKYHSTKYDKWVNLSESVECSLLSVPGKTPHTWTPAARHRYKIGRASCRERVSSPV